MRIPKSSIRLSSALAALACAACVSHHEHMPPQELLKANIEAMQEAVPAKVTDSTRAARVNHAIDEVRQELLSFNAVGTKFQSEVLALNARPDASRGEFEALITRFDKQRISFRARVLALHTEMIAATTDDEWKGLAPHEQRLLTETEER